MPDPKDNTKLSGDTHPPDVESDLPVQSGASDPLGAVAQPRDRPGQYGRGRGIPKAGVLTEGGGDQDDAPGADAGDGGSGGDGGGSGD
ncbi:hypothetical protein [Ramlibacter tataouinensis]|uniref:Uncharacterized protein n=1 Tax=Ramlibacter tataouinensis (strain ATCC BAA-407 / DSM 14655 / LMG 21543 / TTB310) TaxID=365046 RepID=F5Y391_RAMTT|nr:hypothetical protein [Ramlibacter tataouinensis]AEG91178.1 Hypothetical protein Rta_01160 [Ramlibacter tataouinensis TTB310]